jgi:S-adenosylhomocysteine hydrolase
MPGLMAIREEFAKSQPLKGARITGSLHMTIQTGVLVETLQALGARSALGVVQHLLHTRPRCCRPGGSRYTGVCLQGESLVDYWDYTHRIFEFGGKKGTAAEGPNMILDDGGDATLLMHLGVKRRERPQGTGQPRQRGRNLPVQRDQGQAQAGPHLVQPPPEKHHRRDRRNHHRRAPPGRNVCQGHAARCAPSTSTTR